MDVFQEAELLRKVPFFGGLDPAKLKLLAFTSRALRFAAGESLMLAGDPADSAYVVMDGEVEILGATGSGEFVVAVVGRHQLLGEMGVITNAPRVATVRARTPVRALRLSGEVFLRLLTENPDCALHVMRELCGRVAAANARVAATIKDLEACRRQLPQPTGGAAGG